VHFAKLVLFSRGTSGVSESFAYRFVTRVRQKLLAYFSLSFLFFFFLSFFSLSLSLPLSLSLSLSLSFFFFFSFLFLFRDLQSAIQRTSEIRVRSRMAKVEL